METIEGMDLVFQRLPDEHISVRRKSKRLGVGLRLSTPLATRLWMQLDGPRRKPRGPFVVLSYAFPTTSASSFPFSVCFHPLGDDKCPPPPPWPTEWNPHPPPVWRSVALGEWISLPLECGNAPKMAMRASAMREQQVSSSIQERCMEVTHHGEDESFVESLDYYTTMRVKRAYLRMNAESLKSRHEEVDKKIQELLRVVSSAPVSAAAAWNRPSLDTATIDMDDPNALCAPQDCDYDTDGFSDSPITDASTHP